MTKEPIWVMQETARAVHDRQLAEHGGLAGIRDEGLLLSALHSPQQSYHYESPPPRIPALAARYAFGIARNHPFIDGNKRTALVLCRLFLAINDSLWRAQQEETYRMFLALAAGERSLEDLTIWLETHTEQNT